MIIIERIRIQSLENTIFVLHTNQMFKHCFLFLYLFLACLVFGQTESDKLLEQAHEIVYSDPLEAKRISDHILKIGKNEKTIADAYYVQAVSFYVMGQYGKALEYAFSSKNKAQSKGLSEIENKSRELIGRTLKLLDLNVPEGLQAKNQDDIEAAFLAEDLLHKANISLIQNQKDSVFYYTEKAKNAFQSASPGWTTALYLKLKGEYFFNEQQLDSSILNYAKSLEIAKKINNPIILREVNQKLANSYLAMDSVAKFQAYTQQAQNLSPEISKKENEASNSAHMLISNDFDQHHLKLTNNYLTALYVVLGLFMLAVLIKLVFYFRNRNKIKMYQNLFDYFNRQKNAEPAVINEIQTEKAEVQKTPVLLKESENQILQGLEKFEAGKKFTNKDMSLGMLAAQLNTNTKYLSDVINRQKHKNFNSYINELRINYITEKIKTDPNYLNFKVSYLAEECGFSSHSTFTTVFKSIVGVSPIMFVEFVRDEARREKLELVLNE